MRCGNSVEKSCCHSIAWNRDFSERLVLLTYLSGNKVGLGHCIYDVVLSDQELNKRQQQLEQAHAMLLRHHEKTQELEYRQQKAVHQLREEQIQRQHHTELSNQRDYMQRAERELRKKHALELKQQPKSLKVSKVDKILPVYFYILSGLQYPSSMYYF